MIDDFAWFVLKCGYLMIPAYLANMAPVIVKKINFLVYPLDFNKRLDRKPILGKNKTLRGLLFGVLFGILGALLQYKVASIGFFQDLSFFSYVNWLQIGFLMGLGAIIGDAIKSFFKRRLGINPGDKFVPFDQTDFVVGALIFISPVIMITFSVFVTCVLLSFFLHIIVNHMAYFLKIRNEKW